MRNEIAWTRLLCAGVYVNDTKLERPYIVGLHIVFIGVKLTTVRYYAEFTDLLHLMI